MSNDTYRKVRDFQCPECKSEWIDWDECTFTEFLDRDTVSFSASMFCKDCGHKWDAIIDFKAVTMIGEDKKGNIEEQEVELK